MKKVLITTNILFLGAAIFFGVGSCNDRTKTGVTTADTTKCTTCMEYNKVNIDNHLDFNLLRTMAYNFQSNSINNGKTRSVWFSLEKLKRFIYQIESETCKCDSMLGVRIYFSNYPDDNDWTGTFANDLDRGFRSGIVAVNGYNAYAQINTLFMVPTTNEKGVNYDFDPAQSGCTKWYKKEYGTMADTGLYLNNASTQVTALMATNHGDACPPLPPGKTKCPDEGAYFDY
jgi:hypothetical protein